jgi:hypothetical protein
MRTAFNDVGWLTDERHAVMGFSLGFDFCAEHEWGNPFLSEALGLPENEVPVGVEDRTMTEVPSFLKLVEYEWKSRDKRRKTGLPAAMLYLTDSYLRAEESQSPQELSVTLDAGLCECNASWYTPEAGDIASAWCGRDGFAINVRGTENVAKLKALYTAFQNKDIAVAPAAVMGFQRKALAFVIVSSLSHETREDIRSKDLAAKRLADAATATGISAALERANLTWYALSPRWRDGEGSELLFFLNPCKQTLFCSGWFNVEELQEWCAGTGPIVEGLEVSKYIEEQHKDWEYHLTTGLRYACIHLSYRPVYLWLDKGNKVPGVRLRVNSGQDNLLKDGTYQLSQLAPFVEKGRQSIVA